MTIGKRISAGRKALGLSQEALGERLGVSRQAVSKWETDATAPDMKNLIALSRELGIPLTELTGTPNQPSHSPKPIWYFLLPVLCAAAGAVIVGTLLMLGSGPPTEQPAPPPSTATFPTEETSPPAPTPASDFALLWTNADGHEEFLELGEQADRFPFRTTLELTEPEEIIDTDFGAMTHRIADCGAVTVEYDRIEEEPVRESVTRLSSISQSVYTPRYIGPGSTERSLLNAYGDELIYCFKEDGYSLVPHDHFYAYTDGPLTLLFYVDRGEVQGIASENLMDGAGLYDPDHIRRFPLVDGEPNFSLRQEPQ